MNHVNVLAVDPSIRACGWAVFSGVPEDDAPVAMLRKAGLIKTDRRKLDRDAAVREVSRGLLKLILKYSITHVVCEQPTEFQTAGGQAALASGAVGALHQVTGALQAVTYFAASDVQFEWAPIARWKGQLKKEQLRRRLVRRGYQIPATLNHNTVDAIGIGAWYLEEMINGGSR